ncbi:MAG: radical SAM protein [Clostridia bacterium]|nr:radical SAM protein [Clostridia bacterium]
MNYEGRICRTPMERASFMLPVMVGCSYNACRLCMLFKHLKLRTIPVAEVEAELKRVKDGKGSLKRIFLGDGNAFYLGYDYLMMIIDLIHRYFPECSEINMDATVESVEKVTDEELLKLREAGVNTLYIGIESGLDDVLSFMNKCNDTTRARKAIERLHKAGINYGAHIMTGIAGRGRGIENAEATAALLNETKPVSVTNFSMFTQTRSPLWQDVLHGRYFPASAQEAMEEEYRLIELLETETKYDGFQDFIEVRTRGNIPEDKEKMLKKLSENIEKYRNEEPIYACVYVEEGGCACEVKEADADPETAFGSLEK